MTSPFRTARRVEFRDTDAAGIVHFSVFFTYMEEAEHSLWRQMGISVKQTVAWDSHPEQTGGAEVISFPRVAAQCDYKSAARFEDELEIEVRVDGIGEKSVTFAFQITCEGRELATGKLTAVCCRFPKDGPPKSIRIPAEVREKLESMLTP